jgi:two-component system, LytTR family, response regulator
MYNCIIVDDEPNALRVLKAYLAETGLLHLAHATTKPVEALRIIQEQRIDIAFLDIKMPGITGIELAETIRGRCKVIFTTAYSKYVSQALDIDDDVVDYLVKPIRLPRFVNAVERAIRKLDTANALAQLSADRQAAAAMPSSLEYDNIFLRTSQKGNLVTVMMKDIDYIQAMGKQVTIYHGGQATEALLGMKDIEEKLPGKHFIRVHKSFIIALDKIEKVGGGSVKMKNYPRTIPIGDTFYAQFKEATKGRVF